ncbi:MAG: MarR family winged helix-turn-helix transcriptional regulator [Acidimicrobiales bacterium]
MTLREQEDTSVADQLLSAMSSIRRTFRRRAQRPEELSSLTGAQLELVRLVRRFPGVSVVEAASQLRLAPNTVSTLVGQLCERGFMSRSQDASDRRVARLDLAPDIRRKVDAWRDRRVEHLAVAMRALPPRDQRCLESAAKVLERLTWHLESSSEGAEGGSQSSRR